MIMNEKKAREILGEMIDDKDELYILSPYVPWNSWDKTICFFSDMDVSSSAGLFRI